MVLCSFHLACAWPKCRCRLNFGIRAPFVKFVSRPFRILPRLTFQNLCYIARVEVYMVNSPSRPNLRPAAPLSPVECGVMTPLWIWETRLPVHRTAMPNPSRRGVGTARPHGRGCCGLVATRLHHPGPIKAKTPAIVLHQGLSRLIKASAKKHPSFGTSLKFSGWNLKFPRPIPFATLRLRAFALKPRHRVTIKPRSRQKTPVIVLHQA